jgi:hypothetical protein
MCSILKMKTLCLCYFLQLSNNIISLSAQCRCIRRDSGHSSPWDFPNASSFTVDHRDLYFWVDLFIHRRGPLRSLREWISQMALLKNCLDISRFPPLHLTSELTLARAFKICHLLLHVLIGILLTPLTHRHRNTPSHNSRISHPLVLFDITLILSEHNILYTEEPEY